MLTARKDLEQKLMQIKPEEFPAFLARYENHMIHSRHPFADYMRGKFKEKKLLQQCIFIEAELPQRYGYRIIAEEKHTTNRDTILRICLAAKFTPEEVESALILYGMSPLNVLIPRDTALLMAFQNRICSVRDVNAILQQNNLQQLS